MTTPEDLKRAVQESGGCSLVRMRTSQTMHGDFPTGQISCQDGWAAGRLLYRLCEKDARDPELRDLALTLRREASSDRDFAQRIVDYVQDNIAFVREQGEIFQGPMYTVRAGSGDCDDHVRVVYGLAKAGGLNARLAFLASKGASGPKHVLAQVAVPGDGWMWAETTIPAHLGEHPIEAAKRIGAVRQDLDETSVQVSTMGSVSSMTHTAQVDDNFFTALAALERDDGLDAEGVLALFVKESGLDPRAENKKYKCVGINQFCPDTLKTVFSGTKDEFLALPASLQLAYAFKLWKSRTAGDPSALGRARDIYWKNFLPASYVPNASSDTIVAGPGMAWGGLTGEKVVAANSSLAYGKSYITAGDLQRAIDEQKSTATYKEAVGRLNEARGGKRPAPPGTNSMSFVAAGFGTTAVVIAALAGAYLLKKRVRL